MKTITQIDPGHIDVDGVRIKLEGRGGWVETRAVALRLQGAMQWPDRSVFEIYFRSEGRPDNERYALDRQNCTTQILCEACGEWFEETEREATSCLVCSEWKRMNSLMAGKRKMLPLAIEAA